MFSKIILWVFLVVSFLSVGIGLFLVRGLEES